MYHQMKVLNEVKQQIEAEAISQNLDDYTAKIKWLKDKWPENIDSTAGRLIKPILYSIAPSLYHAIVADNLDYFNKHYDKTKMNSNAVLAIACLSGSQKVADFLLNQLHLTYTSPGYEYILSYVSSSNNIKWAEVIASSFKKADKKMPIDIYAYADDDTLNTINKVFEQGKPSSLAPSQ